MHAVLADYPLLTLGLLFLLGLAADYIGRVSAIPRVSLLLLTGVLLGSIGFDLLPPSILDWFPVITDMALLLVGFLLGGRITLQDMRETGRAVILISVVLVGVGLMIVTGGLMLSGASLTVALLLAAASTATDPAATLDVVEQTGSDGPFTRRLTGIVAVDDIWCILVFSITLSLLGLATGEGSGTIMLVHGVLEVLGAVALGIALGVPMAWLSGRIRAGEPTLVEALGIVFLCGGFAQLFGVSFLLTAIVLGMVVGNLARHHEYAFHEIHHIEWPFMILFFVLTGASLQQFDIGTTGLLIVAYIVFRVIGRFVGGWLGARLAGADRQTARWIGVALLPQAGIASGMILIASQHYRAEEPVLLTVIIATTIVFEIVGPLLTRISLRASGELKH